MEEIKKAIESSLSREITAYYITGNIAIPYQLLKSAHRAVHARSAYELLLEYERSPENTISKYSVHYSKDIGYGISVDLKEMTKSIWIPESLLGIKSWWRNGFDIFNQDDLNIFIDLIYQSERQGKDLYDFNLARLIVYCKDENDKFIGSKLDLFLHSKEWRRQARKYSILSLEYIKRNSEGAYSELISSGNKKDIDRYLDCLKSINMISDFYLNEMKLKGG